MGCIYSFCVEMCGGFPGDPSGLPYGLTLFDLLMPYKGMSCRGEAQLRPPETTADSWIGDWMP
jgi:hypothetical protein